MFRVLEGLGVSYNLLPAPSPCMNISAYRAHLEVYDFDSPCGPPEYKFFHFLRADGLYPPKSAVVNKVFVEEVDLQFVTNILFFINAAKVKFISTKAKNTMYCCL